MKKIYTFLILTVAFWAVSAQSVNYGIIGFVDNSGNPISSIVMTPSQNLQPRVQLKNYGPDVVLVTDSVIFDITYDQGYYVTSLILTGEQMHSVSAEETVIIDLSQPIWTAALMDEYFLSGGTICYEVRIVGRAIDPVPDNNVACIPFSRELAVDDANFTNVSLYPNPASVSITLTGVENACVQLFDLSGKMLSVIERASEDQKIDVSSLSEGLYIVRIFDGRNIVTKKLNIIR